MKALDNFLWLLLLMSPLLLLLVPVAGSVGNVDGAVVVLIAAVVFAASAPCFALRCVERCVMLRLCAPQPFSSQALSFLTLI